MVVGECSEPLDEIEGMTEPAVTGAVTSMINDIAVRGALDLIVPLVRVRDAYNAHRLLCEWLIYNDVVESERE